MTRFVALGDVWLDEIRSPGKEAVKDVPGGSVAFATLGARLFCADDPRQVRLVVKAGRDFNTKLLETLRGWDVDLTVLERPDEPASRGVIEYGEDASQRTYHRLTAPLQTTLDDLVDLKVRQSDSFHFFETAAGILEQVPALSSMYPGLSSGTGPEERPSLIWEPHPRSCRPDTLDDHIEASTLVNVFSPNHVELASFFDTSLDSYKHMQGLSIMEKVEVQALKFRSLKRPYGGEITLIIRAAEQGCFVLPPDDDGSWLPPYYPPGHANVVDPTGAGNAFLGGYAIGWQETKNALDAAMYGQVAASFTIEQVGLPKLEHSITGPELWNGVNVRERLRQYQGRDDVPMFFG